jgi:hypothetical protein
VNVNYLTEHAGIFVSKIEGLLFVVLCISLARVASTVIGSVCVAFGISFLLLFLYHVPLIIAD